MSYGEPARPAAGGTRAAVLCALIVVGAALIGFRVDRSSATSDEDARAMPRVTVGSPPPVAPSRAGAPAPLDRLPRGQQGGLGEADGVVHVGVAVVDDEHPAVANLDPGLLRALRQAATDAARDRVTPFLESGWRSPAYQEQLLSQAISTYGSAREAARWVATPEASSHVSGDAVDIGPAAAAAWLSEHGVRYGLCQIYRNEPWHYELRRGAVDRGCPRMYADPTDDPRMQQ